MTGLQIEGLSNNSFVSLGCLHPLPRYPSSLPRESARRVRLVTRPSTALPSGRYAGYVLSRKPLPP